MRLPKLILLSLKTLYIDLPILLQSTRLAKHIVENRQTPIMAPLPLETAVDEYFKNSSPTGTDDAWLHLPEVPDSAEITRPLVSSDPRVPNNIVDGNWPSKSDHLTAQYAFLREESTFALRRAIELVRGNTLSELQFRDISPGIGIYEKVCFDLDPLPAWYYSAMIFIIAAHNHYRQARALTAHRHS